MNQEIVRMTKLYISIIVLGLTSVLGGCESKSDNPLSPTAITTTRVISRSGTDTSYPSILTLEPGTCVAVQECSRDWYQVDHNSLYGFIRVDYLDLEAGSAEEEGHLHTGSGSKSYYYEHARILKATGWFQYVDRNLDRIEYYDWEAFKTDSGPAVGLSFVANGQRIAQIALKNRGVSDVVVTLVHEAAHHEFGLKYNWNCMCDSERYAQEIERRFANDYRRWLRQSKHRLQPRLTALTTINGQWR